MEENSEQIYSATYSNVPVFEFVTEEGPIMRRKSDSWINATHILKIAKFPKARRTRILEKDVQTGTHEKVQGGYGKYQGTYVPLHLGAEIAKTFGIYDTLRPIFEFEYIEGTSVTPPPAPKHNHASALNTARRQQQQQKLRNEELDRPQDSKRTRTVKGETTTEVPKKRGRPKRVALPAREKPALKHSKTAPIDSMGPSMGTFSARQDSTYSAYSPSSQHIPSLLRQETERDALQVMASNLNVKTDDLELASSDEEDRSRLKGRAGKMDSLKDTDDDELMTGRELFGSRDSFAASRDSFEKIVQMHNRTRNPSSLPRQLSLGGSVNGDPYGLMQYHHQHNQFHPLFNQSSQGNNSMREDSESSEYFNSLLNYFLEDDGQALAVGHKALELPERILNPPQPLQKININQPIDNDGNTLFHWACSMANIPLIEFLLSIFSNFIDSELKNYNGETALMFMVKFNNSYQLKNFPAVLDLLFDSTLSVDNYGRTVLHHIAIACSGRKNDLTRSTNGESDSKLKKERFAKYYMEGMFTKIIEFQEYQLLQDNKSRSLEGKKELIAKFINYQDNEGNTAFHIVAHNLSKKCINIFIRYHKYIEFGLRNLVNYTVEDYLASHNYVLRLENLNEDDHVVPTQSDAELLRPTLFPAEQTHSFESQLHTTKLAVNLQNSTVNIVTEKLSELAYAIDRELGEKDEKLHLLYKHLKVFGLDRFKAQKSILKLFNLEYLVEDIEKEYMTNGSDSSNGIELFVVDSSRDKIIQDEISRLQNDMCFQYLTTKEELGKAVSEYQKVREKLTRGQLTRLEEENISSTEATDATALDLAVELQEQIQRRVELAQRLCVEEMKVPASVNDPDEFKENRETESVTEDDSHGPGNANSNHVAKSESDGVAETHKSAIAHFPHSDKLYKYCKLISLSCGMSFSEVENSIDLIEQSLSKTPNHPSV